MKTPDAAPVRCETHAFTTTDKCGCDGPPRSAAPARFSWSLARWAVYSDLYLWPSRKYAGYWRVFRFDFGWHNGPVFDVRPVHQWPANPPKVREAF